MSTAQERFEKLLPFYANGTLSAQDKAFIDEYLGQVPQAAQSLAFTEGLRDTVKTYAPTKLEDHQVQNMLRRWSATQPTAPPEVPMVKPAKRGLFSWGWWSGSFALAMTALLVLVVSPGERGVLHLDGLDGKPDLELRLADGVSPDHADVQNALQKSNAIVLAHSEQDGKHRLTLDLDDRARTQPTLIDELAANGHLESYILIASE